MRKKKNFNIPSSMYQDRPPTMEEWTAEPQLLFLKSLSSWGYSQKEIAKIIGIDEKTLIKWRQKSGRIDEMLSVGMSAADAIIENSLFNRAREGNIQAIKMWLTTRDSDRWGHESKVDEEKAKTLRLDNELKQLKIEELQRVSKEREVGAYRGIPADAIAPAFMKMHHDIRNHEHLEYVLPGGRGSTKSSVISLEIINLIERNPLFHVVVCRRVGDTMRNSVYNQIKWAIEKLGLEDEYKCTTTPLEIVKRSTEQHIYFRGADDPGKIKSIAVPFGHIGVVWFEELDQFEGAEAVRKITQSVVRGSDDIYVFKSFNPPRSKLNWANKDIQYTKENRLVVPSSYLDVPKEWLGKPFIDEAEFLRDVNPDAYLNEYMGEANGHGGNVFENLEVRSIDDEEIATYDRVVNGIDWGWYPDPFAFVRCQYNKAQQELIIFDEIVKHKTRNADLAELVKSHGITKNEVITCDSAEPKSIADFRNEGLNAHGAVKGPGSVDYGCKWLASLRKIVIDPDRTPVTFEEFKNYEFERDDEGEVISGYPDENNHTIDATRYACERLSSREATIKVG